MKNQNNQDLKKKALKVIILFGLVSLFGDISYEGARSVNGPYLKLLAVNATTLGIIVGLGEFLGYGLRLLSGYLSDKTKSYWLFTFLGYGMLISVPLLSLTGIWQIAALFMIMERIGKAIRSPARDTILSQASSQVGTGFGFGLHEAMDQIGAVTGPLIFTVIFMWIGKEHLHLAAYQKGYSFLWIPVLLVLLCLYVSCRIVPNPHTLEADQKDPIPDKLSRIFWLYAVFTFTTTLGFCSFILVAYHFKITNLLRDSQIPLYYAMAMGIDAVAALVIGKMYDTAKSRGQNRNAGLNLLIIIPLITLLMAFFIFSQNHVFIILGVLSWGVVMGIHETIMRSAIADITSLKKRGTGYGLFNVTYGFAFFLGNILLGFLYDHSIALVISAIIFIECLALVIFFMMKKEFLNA